jgi:hypothetical protein
MGTFLIAIMLMAFTITIFTAITFFVFHSILLK